MVEREQLFLSACRSAEIALAGAAEEKYADEPDFAFSKRFEKQMKALQGHMRTGHDKKIGTAARNALVAAALIAIMTITALAVEPVREGIKNFFIEVFEKYSTVSFINDKPKKSGLRHDYGFIPAGYEKADELQTEKLYRILYRDKENNELTSTAFTNRDTAIIDTENVKTEDVMIQNITGLYFENKGVGNLIWTKDGITYYLNGKITKENIINMAKTLNF